MPNSFKRAAVHAPPAWTIAWSAEAWERAHCLEADVLINGDSNC